MAKQGSVKAGSVGLWLGAFSVLEAGRGDAAFQIIGRASSAEDAARVFEERLLHLRETSSLFDAESSVYLDAIIDLSASTFPVPTLVNYVARKESSQSDEWSPVPEQADSRAEIYGWGEDEENDKVVEREPFLQFAKRKTAAKTKGASKAKSSAKAAKPSAKAKSKPKAKRGKK